MNKLLETNQKIIDLVKDHVSVEVLRDFMILLQQYEDEAKRNIIEYQRNEKPSAFGPQMVEALMRSYKKDIAEEMKVNKNDYNI